MKVKHAINLMENLLTILKHYENDNLEDMLKDIENRLPSEKSAPSVSNKKVEEDDRHYGEIITQLKQMPNGEQIQFLSNYKKAELLKIGGAINMKLQYKDKKEILIQTIVNHFGYIQLNELMSQRPKQTIK